MRIRKRHVVVVEPPRPPTISALNGRHGNEDGHLVGQDTCTCCSGHRQLQNSELRNHGFVDQNMDELGKGLSGGMSGTEKNQETATEDKESSAATTLERLGGRERRDERFRDNESNSKATGRPALMYVSEQLDSSEVDVNHPGNKPKESLLYSLYYVFSKLSGKEMLTAREALSRIIEERLPGLDEETGLPSLQVAKVMRSNPYFVHLEGGKFFLCSAPSSDSKDDHDSRNVLDKEHSSRFTSPSFRPKVGEVNSFSRADSAKEHQQQLFGDVDALRTKRARRKEVATVEDAFEKTECRSRGLKREGQKGLKPLNSVPEQMKYSADPVEPICKRYDGRGWKCNKKALPGYSMCRHHHELIVNRLARLRNSGRLGSKKSASRRKTTAKPSKEVGKEVPDVINEGEVSGHNKQNGGQLLKNVKARSLKSINI